MCVMLIIDNIQAMLELIIIATIIIRIYAKKKKGISVKKYTKIIFILCVCWCTLEISMQVISFPTLKAAAAFQGDDLENVAVIKGENSALVLKSGNGQTVLRIYGQKNGRWKMPNYIFMGLSEYSEICDKPMKYTITFERYEMRGGLYVSVSDYSSKYFEERTVFDSEGTQFVSVCAQGRECGERTYCGYVEDVPENYEIIIDGERLKFNWERMCKALS